MMSSMANEILRDWFAAQAMTGLLSSNSDYVPSSVSDTASEVADASYVYADAMLKRRQKA